MSKTFSKVHQDRLLSLLAESSYTADYVQFCLTYDKQCDVDGPALDLASVADVFEANRVQHKLIKRYKVFEFDREDIVGWTWHGSLVVKRHDLLEPMMEGASRTADHAVGSTLLIIARQAGQLKHPPLMVEGGPRPKFDGDLRTMQRMIPDLVRLFRSMKDVIRQNWDLSRDTEARVH